MDEIIKYEIIPSIKVYPEVFSVLSEGFLSFRGGSRVLELIGKILNKLVVKNVDNIWSWRIEKGNSMSVMEKLSRDVIKVMGQKKAND